MVDYSNELDEHTAAIRRFNRFYTKKVGALEESLLNSRLSLAEARLLYEIANRDGPTAAELARDLSLDPGYLSRLLRGFEERLLIRREPSAEDGRQNHLHLTETGRAVFAPLDRRSREAVGAWLDGKPARERAALIAAMRSIEATLGGEPAPAAPIILREHRTGDLGWIAHRQGLLYAEEYGWDQTYEALVAEILAGFVRQFNPAKERAWIAEQAGGIVGSVFLVRQSDTVAKLRLLYVEPSARGLGIGNRLVDECIEFARRAGYSRIMLWTNDVLYSARRIYEAKGFRLVEEEKHHSFGHDLVSQTWELTLSGEPGH
jgi:DNA-binding MarR family transcriptional regulator/GNAT superfamily N-acetyltransferase